jgi:hypothetical protein
MKLNSLEQKLLKKNIQALLIVNPDKSISEIKDRALESVLFLRKWINNNKILPLN